MDLSTLYPFMVREKKSIVIIIPSNALFTLANSKHHTIYGKAPQ